MIKVYYDGKCGLCSREINYYRKIAKHDKFQWIDITVNPQSFTEKGYKLSDGLRQLHIESEHGEILTGVDAFIIIWHNIRYWKLVAFLISLPLIKQLSTVLYVHFADWRFKRLSHCQAALKYDTQASDTKQSR